MERIVKKIIISVLLLLVVELSGECSNSSNPSLSKNISFENCTKVFKTDNVSLYYLAIASVNSSKYKLEELQSNSGYIMFTALGRKYLATVSNVNTNQSMLKITPADSNYNFQPSIVSNIFGFIETNIQNKPKNILLN